MSAHELDSAMMFIHPPLAIAGYVFVFLFTIALFTSHTPKNRKVGYLCLASWLLTGLGLVTGMVWAQIAWGGYWSWDPKETLTLLLFVACSTYLIMFLERKLQITKPLAIVACVLSVATAASSFLMAGLHSFI